MQKMEVRAIKLSIGLKNYSSLTKKFDVLINDNAIDIKAFNTIFRFLTENTLAHVSFQEMISKNCKTTLSYKENKQYLKELLSSDYAITLSQKQSDPLHSEYMETVRSLFHQMKETQFGFASIYALLIGIALSFCYYSDWYKQFLLILSKYSPSLTIVHNYPRLFTFLLSFLLSFIAGLSSIIVNRNSLKSLLNYRQNPKRSLQVKAILKWAKGNKMLPEYKEAPLIGFMGMFFTIVTMYLIFLAPRVVSLVKSFF